MDYEILLRFLLAALWGGLVGAEREYRSISAGFRTMIMISIGSCFFTIMSMAIGGAGNPDRIAANIVTGIGFLGAGVIFRGGGSKVHGITTAATIWAVAAVGMGIGAGFYGAAAMSSILILIVLAVLHSGELLIDKLNVVKFYSITCPWQEDRIAYYEGLIKKAELRFKQERQVKEGETLHISWEVQGHERKHRELAVLLMNDQQISRFEC